MHSFPFFSVVIPTYNCLELLKRAFESVFSQTYQDFEIIVVDNSSKDETQKFLLNMDDSRIKMIIGNATKKTNDQSRSFHPVDSAFIQSDTPLPHSLISFQFGNRAKNGFQIAATDSALVR